MNVNLGEHFETMIRRKVESGRYTNASEVVREALRKYEDDDRLEKVRASIGRSQADFAAGRFSEWNEHTLDEISAEADEADRLGLPIVQLDAP